MTAIVLTGYGGYSLIYNLNKGRGLSVLALIFLCLGIVLFLIYFGLVTYDLIQNRKNKKVIESKIIEQPVEEVVEAQSQEEVKEEPKKEERVESKPKTAFRDDTQYVREARTRRVNRSRYDRDDGGSAYVKEVGSGTILKVEGNRIYDMRYNTYYRIEGNLVKEEGSGPVFEISGNRIRKAYGSYLYEINGSNISKTYGGFYASISGNYLNTYDLSKRYEFSSSLSSTQILVVAALLFGSY